MSIRWSRLTYCVLVGALLTPFAGYLGALAIPGMALLWAAGIVVALFSAPKGALVLLVLPALAGAKFAWPVTCVVLPLTGLLLRRATAWAVPIGLVVGLTAGMLATYLTMISGLMLVNPKDHLSFAIGGGVAGAVLGAIFGFALWRFDHTYPAPPRDAPAAAE